MTMEEKVRNELFERLSDGNYLTNILVQSPDSFTEYDKRILYRLQIEIKLLISLYDDLDNSTLELADEIMIAEV